MTGTLDSCTVRDMSSNYPVLRGTTIVRGEDSVVFVNRRDAVEALRWLTSLGEVEAVFPCGTLYEGYPTWASDPECDWFPDSPSDLIQECNYLAVRQGNRRFCQCGHEHDYEGEYYDEEELAGMAQAGHLPAANAYTMDGRRVW